MYLRAIGRVMLAIVFVSILIVLPYGELSLASGTSSVPISWQTNTAVSATRVMPAGAVVSTGVGSYLYLIGGGTDGSACSMGTGDGRVLFAPINTGTGVLDAWVETTETPAVPENFKRVAAGVATYSGYIYIAGGAINNPTWDGNVWYVKPNNDGTIASWTQSANAMPNWIGSFPFMAAYNDYLYVGGGRNAFGTPYKWSNRLYYAQITPATGAPGVWNTTTSLPSATGAGEGNLVFYNEKAYLILGRTDDSTTSTLVYYATVNPDGTLGAWVSTTSLPAPGNMSHAAFFREDDTLFVILNNGAVYYSKVQPDGSLGAWTADNPTPVAVTPGKLAATFGDYYYIPGNYNCTGSTSVYYAKTGSGSITGITWDGDDGKIGGVTVKLYTDTDNLLATARTDENGVYTFSGLATGGYKVLFESNGFVTQAYNNQNGLATADTVTVTSPNITENINATLSPSGGNNRYIGIVKTGSGTVTSSPAGINCGTVCTASFMDNDRVTLSISPDSGATVSSVVVDPLNRNLSLGSVRAITFRGIVNEGYTVKFDFTVH